jgi:hypothetical protein
MRLQQALFGLFAAGTMAIPAAMFGENVDAALVGRETTSDIPPMDIDWSVFDSGEFEELVPVPENKTVGKRADKLDLKNSATLTWKSGRYPSVALSS